MTWRRKNRVFLNENETNYEDRRRNKSLCAVSDVTTFVDYYGMRKLSYTI